MTFAIQMDGLTVSFPSGSGTVDALSGLSLSVPVGTVCGFLGPNGAGKTTAIHTLLGFVTPTSGSVRIFGIDVRESIARSRIGYLPEHPDTYRFLTGRELLTLTGRLFGMSGGKLRKRVAETLRLVEMEKPASRRIASYSRGMMQRICLGQALVNDPDLLVLDEPTGGMDPFGRMSIRKIISDCRNMGKTVFFSSHELSEVETTCDHIAIISRGKIIAEGPISRLVSSGEGLEKFFIRVVEAERNAKT